MSKGKGKELPACHGCGEPADADAAIYVNIRHSPSSISALCIPIPLCRTCKRGVEEVGLTR